MDSMKDDGEIVVRNLKPQQNPLPICDEPRQFPADGLIDSNDKDSSESLRIDTVPMPLPHTSIYRESSSLTDSSDIDIDGDSNGLSMSSDDWMNSAPDNDTEPPSFPFSISNFPKMYHPESPVTVPSPKLSVSERMELIKRLKSQFMETQSMCFERARNVNLLRETMNLHQEIKGMVPSFEATLSPDTKTAK